MAITQAEINRAVLAFVCILVLPLGTPRAPDALRVSLHAVLPLGTDCACVLRVLWCGHVAGLGYIGVTYVYPLHQTGPSPF